jgi:hypothetical protein
MSENEKDRQAVDPGAYISNEPEFASETIPGGVQRDDERVAAGDTQSTGESSAAGRQQGRDDEWPQGHRQGGSATDDDVRRAGEGEA